MSQKITHASLFSGFGAADLAADWMGWNNAFWCEIDKFPRTVLSYWFPKAVGYENIKETDFAIWRGKIDVLTGGFPCQPFSCAGKRKGAEDDRYLWPEMLRAIREIQPSWVVGENVAGITSMVQPGCEVTVESQASLFEKADKETLLEQEFVIETVCRDLEHEGYSVQPIVIPACAVGAPHRRDRVWFIANRTNSRIENMQFGGKDGTNKSSVASNANSVRGKAGRASCGGEQNCQENRQCVQRKIVRLGKKRFASYPSRQRCDNRSDNWTERSICYDKKWDTAENQSERTEWKHRACKNSPNVTDPNRIRLQTGICSGGNGEIGRETPDRYVAQHTLDFRGTLLTTPWENFPTQSPVCRRDDGLPFDVVRLAIPFGKWREGAIKGYGNAIVPQVIYEIFKAIDMIDK